jgi:hypothetical protein
MEAVMEGIRGIVPCRIPALLLLNRGAIVVSEIVDFAVMNRHLLLVRRLLRQ